MLVDAFQSVEPSLQNLHTQIVDEITSRAGGDSLSDLVSIRAMENIADRLQKIRKILQIQRYDLVFIGQVGTGKTTAICHLFGLTHTVERRSSTGINALKKKPLTQVKELLSTGSGKTTICEVVICPSEHTSIEIDPYSVDEVKQLIDEFGLWIWQKVYPSGSKHRVEIPPNELLRALRNILALPELAVDGKMQDLAIDFAQGFAPDAYAQFQSELLARARLSERSASKIIPTAEDRELKLWVSQTFQALNVAKIPNFSIPKRIYLNLDRSILAWSDDKYRRLNGIVDTRGLDVATKDRRDLSDYIRERDNAICIFTDRFASAPGNSIEIIGKYLTSTARDLDSKFALLVMPRKGEPEKLLGSDGLPVEDFQTGITLRSANIDNVFSNENIAFPSTNIIFYDALQAYLDDGTLHPHYEPEEIDLDRERILAAIERTIDDRECKLVAEIDLLQEQFERIKQGKEWDTLEQDILIAVKNKIGSIADLELYIDNFNTEYVALLSALHHMVLRATNNRYGNYELRGIDIYFNGKYLAEKLVRDRTQIHRSEISTALDWVESQIVTDSGLHPIVQRLRSQINDNYEDMVVTLSTEIERLLTDNLFAPQDYEDNEFWQQVIDRWGCGAGYKHDVLAEYQDRSESVNFHLANSMRSAWQQQIILPIVNFLGGDIT
jgi:hypothetical protein